MGHPNDVRLAAVSWIAEIFESHITGLFFNVLPPPPITLRFDIFSPFPGDSDVISHVERLSSNETKLRQTACG